MKISKELFGENYHDISFFKSRHRIKIVAIIKIESKYLEKIFALLLRTVAKIIIKKGFKTSIGWNLGKKNKSIHLFEPFTSIPIIGTNNKENKEI